MFSSVFVFALAVFILLVLSVKERLRNRSLKERAWEGMETKSSPLSEALTGLIGTAGGIYLSMVMLFTFMELDVPKKVEFLQIGLEPLAAISFSLAIAQPFFTRVRQMYRKNN